MASAQRNNGSGVKPEIVAVAFRQNFADMMKVYNITVVAPKKGIFGKSFQQFADPALFSDDLVCTVEEQMPALCLDKMTFRVIEPGMSFPGGKPKRGFRYGDLKFWIIIVECTFDMPDQSFVVSVSNIMNGDAKLVHENSLLFLCSLLYNDPEKEI